jgi:hypothetical protein
MDPSIIGNNLGGPVILAILTSSYVKPLIELRYGVDAPLHDFLIRAAVLVMALVGYLVNYLGNVPHHTFAGLESATSTAFIASVGAVVTYHLVGANVPTLPGAKALQGLSANLQTVGASDNVKLSGTVTTFVPGKPVIRDPKDQLPYNAGATVVPITSESVELPTA